LRLREASINKKEEKEKKEGKKSELR